MEWSEYDKRVLPLLLLCILLTSVLLGILLRRLPLWVRGIPTALVALAAVFLEVVKQQWNAAGEQDPFCLPFHYCSLFVVILPLAELFGDRMSRIFRPIATSMAFVVSVAMYTAPEGVLGTATEFFGKTFRPTHTLLLHHLVVLYLFLAVALRLYRPRITDPLLVGAVGALYMAAAIPLSYRLDTNYCNILTSVLPPLESFRLEAGQRAYTVLLCGAMTLGAAFGSVLHSILYRLLLFFTDRRDDRDGD